MSSVKKSLFRKLKNYSAKLFLHENNGDLILGSIEPLIEVRNLAKHFPIKHGFWARQVGVVRAVDNVSLSINPGKTLGLVGESGCGKTTAGRALLRLIEPSFGEVLYRGTDILKVSPLEMRRFRRKLQIVFQDPYSSLNPRITVGGMLREILQFHKIVSRKQINDRVDELLVTVGLAPEYANRYPHEFSGGQRQRIGIVRALAVEPEFLVLDEPVSALDVSIQAQILNLLKDLQNKFKLSYLFISHALSVIDHIAENTAVMYLGRVVESGETSKIVAQPLHPYTKALIAAVPRPDPEQRQVREPLTGDVPNSLHPPSGCHFHPRCPMAKEECSTWKFHLKDMPDGRKVACILY